MNYMNLHHKSESQNKTNPTTAVEQNISSVTEQNVKKPQTSITWLVPILFCTPKNQF